MCFILSLKFHQVGIEPTATDGLGLTGDKPCQGNGRFGYLIPEAETERNRKYRNCVKLSTIVNTIMNSRNMINLLLFVY